MSKSALIVVDVQKDFQEGGALPVPGGLQVAKDILRYLQANAGSYDAIVFSRDFHDHDNDNGGHFAVEPNLPDYVDTWPKHCVGGTEGAQYAPEIANFLDEAFFEAKQPPIYEIIKGMGKPAYSAFEGVFIGNSGISLRAFGQIDVCGLAYDHCVSATAFDANRLTDAKVTVLADYTASVSRATEIKTTVTLTTAGIRIV